MKFVRMRAFNLVSISSSAVAAGCCVALLALWAVCFGFAQPALAEVRVSGDAKALKVETRHATLEEVLRALRSSYKFRYRTKGALQSAISGTYSGSLPRVVTRLLEGHDFVMHRTPNYLEVSIFSRGQSAMHVGSTSKEGCRYMDGTRIVPVKC